MTQYTENYLVSSAHNTVNNCQYTLIYQPVHFVVDVGESTLSFLSCVQLEISLKKRHPGRNCSKYSKISIDIFTVWVFSWKSLLSHLSSMSSSLVSVHSFPTMFCVCSPYLVSPSSSWSPQLLFVHHFHFLCTRRFSVDNEKYNVWKFEGLS